MAINRHDPTPDQYGSFDLLHFQPGPVHRAGDRCTPVYTRHAHAQPEARRPGGATLGQMVCTPKGEVPSPPPACCPCCPKTWQQHQAVAVVALGC